MLSAHVFGAWPSSAAVRYDLATLERLATLAELELALDQVRVAAAAQPASENQ